MPAPARDFEQQVHQCRVIGDGAAVAEQRRNSGGILFGDAMPDIFGEGNRAEAFPDMGRIGSLLFRAVDAREETRMQRREGPRFRSHEPSSAIGLCPTVATPGSVLKSSCAVSPSAKVSATHLCRSAARRPKFACTSISPHRSCRKVSSEPVTAVAMTSAAPIPDQQVDSDQIWGTTSSTRCVERSVCLTSP